jgi:hypothetical protein
MTSVIWLCTAGVKATLAHALDVKKTVHESTELWFEVADFDNQSTLAPMMAKFGVDPQRPLSTWAFRSCGWESIRWLCSCFVRSAARVCLRSGGEPGEPRLVLLSC